VIILSLSGAYLFSFYFTRRIKKMSNIARNMADLDFSWYCPDNSNDELGILAVSLNELSDKLSNALRELKEKNLTLTDEIEIEKERERRQMLFFSGVSHELKTPIAVVIGQLEGMQANIGVYKNREKYLARSAEILRSLDGFIREILSVSHIGISEKNTEKINISDILKSAINDNLELSETCEIEIRAKIQNDIFIYGDEKLLKKAFLNVINNALIYTQSGGCVEIISEKNTFKIINSPAHIDEKHLPHIFDAFYRADKTVGNGSGLGLYITRLIFETFGMSCKIENFKNSVQFTIKI
jgi:signal transduction histidine kinase